MMQFVMQPDMVYRYPLWGVAMLLVGLAAGAAMCIELAARLFVPVHHKTFSLSREPIDEPIERTEQALAAEAGRLAVRDVGDTVRIA